MTPEEQQLLCNAIEFARKIETASEESEQSTTQIRITDATNPVAKFPLSSTTTTTTSTSTSFYQNAVREDHKKVINPVSGCADNPFVGNSRREKRCMVCGEKASGVHYLVWSCSSCKTFFRRTIMENRNYSCKKLGNCPIDEQTRCACRHCRFQKCFQVGMKFTDSQLTFYDWRARILSITIDWIKSFDIFQEFPPLDAQALVTHSAFALLALNEAFHTPERYSDRLVYPDGLQVTRNTTGNSNGYERAMVAIINDILSPIRRIHLTDVEYVFIQILLLFDPDCLALSEQGLLLVTQEREKLLERMQKYLAEHANNSRLEGATRLAELLMLIPKIQKVAKFKREFICANDERRYRGLSENGESLLAIQLAKRYAAMSFF